MADKRAETMGISRGNSTFNVGFYGIYQAKVHLSWRCHANFMGIWIEWDVNWHKKRAKMNRNRDLIGIFHGI